MFLFCFAVYEDPEEVKAILERCNPQCTLNQEPGYVIYSAVGSFYAPMLVMMFFNWRIYRTATKTTKAIRQGWTRVKGVSGDDEIGLGIHRGGGGGGQRTSNGGSGSNKATTAGLSSHARNPSDRTCNGLAARDLETYSCHFTSATRVASTRPTLCLPPSSHGSGGSMKRALPRSASSCLISNGGNSLSKNSYLSTNLRQSRGRSKSAVNVGPRNASKHEMEETEKRPKLSHHQPCPNHVGGKTFAEIGTQTLPKNRTTMMASRSSSPTTASAESIGCVAGIKQK